MQGVRVAEPNPTKHFDNAYGRRRSSWLKTQPSPWLPSPHRPILKLTLWLVRWRPPFERFCHSIPKMIALYQQATEEAYQGVQTTLWLVRWRST